MWSHPASGTRKIFDQKIFADPTPAPDSRSSQTSTRDGIQSQWSSQETPIQVGGFLPQNSWILKIDSCESCKKQIKTSTGLQSLSSGIWYSQTGVIATIIPPVFYPLSHLPHHISRNTEGERGRKMISALQHSTLSSAFKCIEIQQKPTLQK